MLRDKKRMLRDKKHMNLVVGLLLIVLWMILVVLAGCATRLPIIVCVPSTLVFKEAEAVAQGLTCGDMETMSEAVTKQRSSSPSPSQFSVPSPPRIY
jgi:hypothetical protein